MKISAFRNRLRVDNSLQRGINEELNGSKPFFWNGSTVQFELGLFRKTTLVDDVSNLVSIHLEVKDDSNRNGAALMSGSTTEITAITAAEWDSESEDECHAKLEFTSAQSNLNLNGQKSAEFWMVISAVRNDGERITLGGDYVTVEEDGATVPAPPVGGSNFRFNEGFPEFKFDDNSWHRFNPITIDGIYQLEMVQAASGINADFNAVKWRTNDGYPELQYGDNSWHRLVPSIVNDIYVLEVNQAAAGAFNNNTANFRVNLGYPEMKWPDNSWHRLDPLLVDGHYGFEVKQQPS